MHHAFAVPCLRLALATVTACAALALFDAGSAPAQNLASCTFQAHLTLSGGSFSSDGSQRNASCTGLVSGALAGSDGLFDAHGSYTGNACSIGSWRGSFEAQVPTAVYFIDPQYAQISGSVELTQAGATLMVSGTGTVDGQPVAYMGVGSFTPDAGQGCSISGGVLSEHVVLADGGPGGVSQPAAQAGPPHQSPHKRHHKYRGRRHNRH
jgi:hypothetical protein